MTPAKSIILQARRELIIFAAVIAVALTLGIGSSYWRAQQQAQLDQFTAQSATQQSELAQKQTDLSNIQVHLDKFNTLKQQGLVGSADREGWVEQFNASRQATGLAALTVTYTLAPAKTVGETPTSADEVAPEADPAAAQQHDLQFDLQGTHEVEILKLLQDYKTHVDGRFRIQGCEFSNAQENGLQAKCTLRFFNLPTPPKTETPT